MNAQPYCSVIVNLISLCCCYIGLFYSTYTSLLLRLLLLSCCFLVPLFIVSCVACYVIFFVCVCVCVCYFLLLGLLVTSYASFLFFLSVILLSLLYHHLLLQHSLVFFGLCVVSYTTSFPTLSLPFLLSVELKSSYAAFLTYRISLERTGIRCAATYDLWI